MQENKKIMILGCGGMLGEAFYNIFKDEYKVRASDIDVNEAWLAELDVRNYDAIREEALEFKPDFIFNLAAYTDLEYCENNPMETYLTNTTGAENGALISEELGSTYIFISTAGIFDGGQDSYNDYDIPVPLSVYGKSKYYAELSITEICSKYFIFRAGWMMGGGQKDKKFVHKIIKQLLAGKKELHVVNDLKGSPTYTYDFAENTKEMISTKFYGLYNMTCEGGPTRYEVAAEMLNIFNLQDRIEMIEVKSDYFSEEYFAPRPDSEVLENLKLKLRNLDKMRDWDLSLRDYLEKDWTQIVKDKVS
ncbi:MAG: SDR family oxidoreductase [Candidatus Marinimicrobia bacterium]|nr:SDR family oxidoreductase [Candidatus Neomarinimicrobiota bacterium]